jgi:hypothetical protein
MIVCCRQLVPFAQQITQSKPVGGIGIQHRLRTCSDEELFDRPVRSSGGSQSALAELELRQGV